MKPTLSALRVAIGLASLGVALTPTIGLTQQAPEAILNTASFTYQAPKADSELGELETIPGVTKTIEQPLVDPYGQITGCNGELLPSYQGFTVALYEAAANGLDLGNLLDLTQTEFPDAPGNGVSAGLRPNVQNANPFSVGNDGRYNFLFDASKGQTDVGRSYIMVIKPGVGSGYAQRRIRLAITGKVGTNDLSYTATALDGRPLGADNVASVNGVINIRSAVNTGLSVGVLNFSASTCDAQDVQITKSADRANAEMGDTVLYRLSIRNLSRTALTTLTTTDVLPAGFRFLDKTLQAEVGGVKVPVTVTRNDRTLTIVTPSLSVPVGGVLNLIYATQLTSDAMRGTGENIASVTGKRSDNGTPVKDGPARHKLRVRSGLLSDCGTLLGRVFVDKNFDGEQQPGEPGVANAVILLDDGNRITTDNQGLYHIANVLAGSRTGVLDQTSVPGFTLAPNSTLIERNSQSRLVKLSPGGLARMNFAVTPAAKEAAPCNCETK
jgi:uncharacterized repeat protein (TIGR01451 family)